jgi:KaiC/GvpD/RAD55 family RecA-like ATPase
MLVRCIAPAWLLEQAPGTRRVLEGDFSEEQIEQANSQGYNIYWLPNCPSEYTPGVVVDGSHIDTFRYVFSDMDLKEGKYASKEAFIERVKAEGPPPTFIVDSGNGVHVYWAVDDLDGMSFLRFQRRIIRKFDTDVAVAKIYQLMRLPGTVNTKSGDSPKYCDFVLQSEVSYTCEQLDRLLPPVTQEDEAYCQQHYNRTYKITAVTEVDEKIPPKFGALLASSKEAKEIWTGNVEDRSAADYRLGHIMFANGFTRDEALSVLVNSAKALPRAPAHRLSYAEGIVDKIWTYELQPEKAPALSSSVREILSKSGDMIKGTRFPCYSYFDDTEHGFRLGQVIGLVAGVGVGKTAVALNMFMGFVKSNPDYVHFFVPLEQPKEEIADRWKSMCGKDEFLYDKVEILSNQNEDHSFRHLSLEEIRDYILHFQTKTGKKVGAVVIDHIGCLKKKTKDGENQGILDICHQMKPFALQTNTMLIMQSQAPREKAGIGDLELNKDAAYGTVFFEAYCDYLITVWQPVKRCYKDGAPTVTAYKFCKIRHKEQGVDVIQEDTPYSIFYDPKTQLMRQLTEDEGKALAFFALQAANQRKRDRKTEVVDYVSIPVRTSNG